MTMHPVMPAYDQLEATRGDRVTAISREEGEFLFTFICERHLKRTLEVGLAYGFSAAYIISATRAPHIAIDPFPETYDGMAVVNLERLGQAEFLRLEKDLAHNALPRLLAGGVVLDFAFVDGDHKFDTTFVEFYYLDLMLETGGYLFFHDAWMASIQSVRSWIVRNKRNYQALAGVPPNMLAFQKTGPDDRPWTHFVPFGTSPSAFEKMTAALRARAWRYGVWMRG